MRLAQFDAAPELVLRAIDEGLEEYNHSVAPLKDVRPLAVVLFADDQSIIGGAVGRTWGRCCELLQLWVSPGHRRGGHGSTLLTEFELRGRVRGCDVFYLTTLSYQAPDFYIQRGYGILAKIEGYPNGIAKYLLQRQA